MTTADYVKVPKTAWKEYSTLVDLVAHERDKLSGKFIASSDVKELEKFLDA